MEFKSKLKAILEDVLNEDSIDIENKEADLVVDLGMDSMDALDITDRVEREFGIEIETKSIYSLKTIGDLLDVIAARKKAESNERAL